MVAHDFTDMSFLLPMTTWCWTFFEEKFVGHALHDVIECCANRRIQSGAMSQGGSFDLWGASPEFYVGRSRSPQWCRARRRWQSAVREGFVDGTDVVSIAAPPRCPIEITCNQVYMLTNQTRHMKNYVTFHTGPLPKFFVALSIIWDVAHDRLERAPDEEASPPPRWR